jgi:hypothetical protein
MMKNNLVDTQDEIQKTMQSFSITFLKHFVIVFRLSTEPSQAKWQYNCFLL